MNALERKQIMSYEKRKIKRLDTIKNIIEGQD